MRGCCRCDLPVGENRVLVGVPFANSGAGGPASYACLPCARAYARTVGAPDWVAEDIARTEARLGHRDPP